MAYEEPAYEVIHSTDAYEVRRYQAYLVAEVDVAGDFEDAGGKAFRILADYIFGNNRAAEEMNMTASVESRPADDGTEMAMTVPVTSSSGASGTGTYTYGFVMERKYTLDTLPRPNDPRIQIRSVEPRVVAARRYSGFWTEANYRNNERRLLEALAADGITPAGEPILARYNAPFTPWFLRRNEVLVEIAGSEQQAAWE